MPRRRENGSNSVRDMPLGRGNGADHAWTSSTPTSLRREQAEKSRKGSRDRNPGHRADFDPFAARSRVRTITPEELAAAVEKFQAGLLVPAEEHRAHRRLAWDLPHGVLDHVTPGRR